MKLGRQSGQQCVVRRADGFLLQANILAVKIIRQPKKMACWFGRERALSWRS